MKEDLLPCGLVVQVREIPAQRMLTLSFSGPPGALGESVARLTGYALEQDVGPCGPTVARYPRFLAEPDAGGSEAPEEIEAELLVPVRGRPEAEDYALVQVDRLQVACINYSGPLDGEFRRAHEDLFAWMDAHGVPRAGTAHAHAYLAGHQGAPEWSVEIRVPIVGGRAPMPPV